MKIMRIALCNTNRIKQSFYAIFYPLATDKNQHRSPTASFNLGCPFDRNEVKGEIFTSTKGLEFQTPSVG